MAALRFDVLTLFPAIFESYVGQSLLDDAIRATPASRYRVAAERGGPISGYAVTGRAADRGYLQRLAVEEHRARPRPQPRSGRSAPA